MKSRIVLLCVSVVCALILTESVLRVYESFTDPKQSIRNDILSRLSAQKTQENGVTFDVFDQRDPEDRQWSREQRILHPYLGYVRNHFEGGDVNTLGFLGPDPLAAYDSNSVVIGLFGGSVAQDFYGQTEEYFKKQLSGNPEFQGKKIILLPITQVGYKEPQQLFAFSYLLTLGVHFDMIIVIDGVNELIIPEDNRGYGITPSYPLDWIAYSQMGIDPHVAALVNSGRAVVAAREYLRQTVWKTGIYHYSSGLLIWNFLDTVLRQRQTTLDRVIIKELSSGSLSNQTKGVPIVWKNTDAYYSELANIWSRASRQMYYLAKAGGIRYYHFLQPNQYVKASKPFSGDERKHAYVFENNSQAPVLEAGYPFLKAAGEILKKDGVPFTDLTGIFVSVTDTIYVDTCCHMNSEGNKMMADMIIRAIVQ